VSRVEAKGNQHNLLPDLYWITDFKCEYVSIELPCKRCSQKQLPCGSQEKVWGERRERERSSQVQDGQLNMRLQYNLGGGSQNTPIILRQPRVPDNETLSSQEGMYIRFAYERLFRFTFEAGSMDCLWLADSMFRRFGPTLSSKPVRYAVLLYALSYQRYTTPSIDCQRLLYLDQFYRSTRDAITSNAYADVMYACYSVCAHGLIAGQAVGELLKHFDGFLLSFQKLKGSSTLTAEEYLSIHVMLGGLLCGVWVQCRHGQNMAWTRTRLTLVQELLKPVLPLQLAETTSYPSRCDEPSTVKARRYLKTEGLDTGLLFLQIYFNQFFMRPKPSREDQHRDSTALKLILEGLGSAMSEDRRFHTYLDRMQVLEDPLADSPTVLNLDREGSSLDGLNCGVLY
jgi:hypothetical protein